MVTQKDFLAFDSLSDYAGLLDDWLQCRDFLALASSVSIVHDRPIVIHIILDTELLQSKCRQDGPVQ